MIYDLTVDSDDFYNAVECGSYLSDNKRCGLEVTKDYFLIYNQDEDTCLDQVLRMGYTGSPSIVEGYMNYRYGVDARNMVSFRCSLDVNAVVDLSELVGTFFNMNLLKKSKYIRFYMNRDRVFKYQLLDAAVNQMGSLK